MPAARLSTQLDSKKFTGTRLESSVEPPALDSARFWDLQMFAKHLKKILHKNVLARLVEEKLRFCNFFVTHSLTPKLRLTALGLLALRA